MKPDEQLMRLAAMRHGAFSLDEARAVGLSSDMLTNRVARGLIIREEPGIYRFAAAPQTWKQRVYIATLAEHGYASIRTAGALWPLDGCRPGIVEVTTERWRRRPNQSIRVHETRLLHADDLAEIDGIPVLSRERTVVDLAMVLPAHRVEMAMDSHGVDLDRMWECVERLDSRGRPWVAIPRRLLASRLGRDGVPPNLFEKRLFGLFAVAFVVLAVQRLALTLSLRTDGRSDPASPSPPARIRRDRNHRERAKAALAQRTRAHQTLLELAQQECPCGYFNDARREYLYSCADRALSGEDLRTAARSLSDRARAERPRRSKRHKARAGAGRCRSGRRSSSAP